MHNEKSTSIRQEMNFFITIKIIKFLKKVKRSYNMSQIRSSTDWTFS